MHNDDDDDGKDNDFHIFIVLVIIENDPDAEGQESCVGQMRVFLISLFFHQITIPYHSQKFVLNTFLENDFTLANLPVVFLK